MNSQTNSLVALQEQLPFVYNDQKGGFIYSRIDTLTFVFNDTTINHVLRWLTISEYVDEVFASLYRQDGGYCPKFIFTFNQIRFEVPQIAFYRAEDPNVPMFEIMVPEIRVHLGGHALDYLRSLGVEFIDHRFVKPDLGEIGSFHCTRCDWAFDLVDYKPEFLNDLISFLESNMLPSGRVPLVGRAVKCSIRSGYEKTVYLGSSQGAKLLRVYDKKLQLHNPLTGCWTEAPYGDVNSWIRIEWQLRNNDANGSFFPDPCSGVCQDYRSILKEIYCYYNFTNSDFDNKNRERPSLDFWQTFLPWEEIERKIIQNAKYVQPKKRSDKVSDFISRIALRNVGEFIHMFGIDKLLELIDDYCKNCWFEKDRSDPSSPARRSLLLSQLAELQEEGFPGVSSERDRDGFYNEFGRLRFGRAVK